MKIFFVLMLFLVVFVVFVAWGFWSKCVVSLQWFCPECVFSQSASVWYVECQQYNSSTTPCAICHFVDSHIQFAWEQTTIAHGRYEFFTGPPALAALKNVCRACSLWSISAISADALSNTTGCPIAQFCVSFGSAFMLPLEAASQTSAARGASSCGPVNWFNFALMSCKALPGDSARPVVLGSPAGVFVQWIRADQWEFWCSGEFHDQQQTVDMCVVKLLKPQL